MADANIRRVVVKVGSSVLTDERGRIVPTRLEQLVDQMSAFALDHRQPVLVTSGAIACGMAALSLTRRPKALAKLQACAAVGQGELMHLYSRAFAQRGVLAGQVLLTQEDLANRSRFRNAKQTLLTLLHGGVVPIVNENDTVAVEEITFGDNDRLAALVAVAVEAQLLVILSDVDGFLKDGRVVERIEGVNHGHASGVYASGRQTTKGGMASKLEAARIVGHSGIPMIIANGTRGGVLRDLLAGQSLGTLFVPPRNRLTSKRWWMAYALRRPKGAVVVDAGAAEALAVRGKSLLASGVQAVQGQFDARAFVAILDARGEELARGITAFSSKELGRIRGLTSADAARALGQARVKEVIHRDHLVLMRELTT